MKLATTIEVMRGTWNATRKTPLKRALGMVMAVATTNARMILVGMKYTE